VKHERLKALWKDFGGDDARFSVNYSIPETQLHQFVSAIEQRAARSARALVKSEIAALAQQYVVAADTETSEAQKRIYRARAGTLYATIQALFGSL
jgi:hypothetical protein